MSVQKPPSDQIRAEIVKTLHLDAFPLRGYRNADFLEAALAAGFEVTDLATAQDVSKGSIYRAVVKHSLDLQKPPSNGPAKLLWGLDPDAVEISNDAD